MNFALLRMAERPSGYSGLDIGRGCDRRKDHELLLLRPRWWLVCDPRMITVGKLSRGTFEHDHNMFDI